MRTRELPLEYLIRASKETLESFELTRLNRAANFRKEARDVMNDWVQAEIESRLARFVLERRRAQSGDCRSLSSEFAPPLEVELLSSDSLFAQSVAEANSISFSEPAGNFPEGAVPNCLARMNSALPPASSPTTQLSFLDSLPDSPFQLDLFARAPRANADLKSNAPEDLPQTNAIPGRALPARRSSLLASEFVTCSKALSATRRDALRRAHNRFVQTRLSKRTCPRLSHPLAASGVSGIASRKLVANHCVTSKCSSAAAILRPRPPMVRRERVDTRSFSSSQPVDGQAFKKAAPFDSRPSLRSADAFKLFERIGVSNASLVRSYALAGAPSPVHRQSQLSCDSFKSSEFCSRLRRDDSDSREITFAESRNSSGARVSFLNLMSRSNVDFGKFMLAPTNQVRYFASHPTSAVKFLFHHRANLCPGGVIKIFIETVEWIYPHIPAPQVAPMRFSPVLDPRFIVSTGPDESLVIRPVASHPFRVLRRGTKSQLPGSAIFCRNSRSAFAVSRPSSPALPAISIAFHASTPSSAASDDCLLRPFRASNENIFAARFSDDSNSFVLAPHFAAAARPPYLSSHVSCALASFLFCKTVSSVSDTFFRSPTC